MIELVPIHLKAINYVYGLHKKAYILMNSLREQCLVNTEFKNATVETIRTKLLKLGTVITITKRRVLIAISSACPYKNIFTNIYKRLSRLPCPNSG